MKERIDRRQAMVALGAAGAAFAFGCGGNTPTSPTEAAAGTTATTGAGAANAACAVTPSETVGPYPSLTDLFRSDIREGKPGTPLALTIAVVNANNNCAPVPDANVEVWQCDAAGNYSQYGTQRAETYLRGYRRPMPAGR